MKTFTWIALALIGVAAPLSAQQPQAITYDEAVAIALEKSTSVLLAQNALETSSASVSQSKLAFVPDLRISTSGAQSVGRTFSEGEGSIINTTTKSLNAGISSSVTLFDGFRNVANLKAAQLNQGAAQLDLKRTQQTAVFTVTSQFLALAQAQEQLKVQREALVALETEEKQIKAFVDAGARPITDLYQQQASVASARANVVGAERNVGQAQLDLVQTLLLDPKLDYTFATPAAVDAAAADAMNVSSLIESALTNRVDLNALNARSEAAEQAVRAANASRLPSVQLSAGYNTGASSASELALSEQLDQRRGGSLSLSVSIPLFDRNAGTAAQQARIAAENADIQLNAQKQEVAVQVRKANLDYASAQEQLTAAEAQLKAAELALTSARQRYQAGVSTLVEVTQARATQVQAASAVVNARYELVLQRKVIDYYTGA